MKIRATTGLAPVEPCLTTRDVSRPLSRLAARITARREREGDEACHVVVKHRSTDMGSVVA